MEAEGLQEITEGLLRINAQLLYSRFEFLQEAGFAPADAFQIVQTRGLV